MIESDKIYEICLDLAKSSPCQKRGFGCVLTNGIDIISQSNNHDIDTISNLCKPRCIRFDMSSGSDSMIGDCGHAEEHTIWECIKKTGSAVGTELWVLGVSKPQKEVLENTKFYCVRCSTLMRYAKVSGVHIHYNNEWHWVTTSEAYATSLEYSIKK